MNLPPTVPTVELARIHDHPANPRRHAVADDEMVESIRRQGLLEPLMVAPRADGDWDLIDGHRRKHGATLAGLTEVPINPRYDLVTEAQKVEVMVVTGLQKALLTPVEEAAGYEQLALLGMDAAAIAAATGFGVRRVKDRLKLNALPENVREKVHVGDATLTDIAALDEFAGDPVATAKLEENLGSDNFQLTVTGLRARRARIEHRDQVEAGFIELGAVRVRSVPGDPGAGALDDGTEIRPVSIRTMHTEELRDPAGHDGCLGYLVYPWDENAFNELRLLCVDPSKHPRPVAPEQPAHVQSDWEARQAERAERAAQHEAAVQTRASWLREHFTAMFPARSHGALAAAAKAGLPLLVIDGRDTFADPDVLLGALDALPESRDYNALTAAKASYAATLADAKPTTVLQAFAGYLAALVVDLINVEDPQFVDDLAEAQYMLGVWDWLKQAGYPLSDVDKAERTALEVRHTELAAEAEAQAS